MRRALTPLSHHIAWNSKCKAGKTASKPKALQSFALIYAKLNAIAG